MQDRETATAAVVHAVRRIARGLRMAAVRTQSQLGISAAQLFVLRHLADGAAHSIKDLAHVTVTDRSSVAALVDRLAACGLVQRERDARDLRRAAIRITASGADLLERAPVAPTELLLESLEQLPDDQLADLATGLEQLVHAMGLESAPAPLLFEDVEDAQA